MEEIQLLVGRAIAAENSLEERNLAYAGIVARFQDLAVACAYSVLKDFYLAEDAAQAAFVTAWQNLAQLRQPGAFAGWFKRIVLTECGRLTRGRRLYFVPLPELENEPGDAAINGSPHADYERLEASKKILEIIESLNDNERLVVIMFYWDEYSQQEISRFLEVPVTTVVKRLYSARQKIKARLMSEFKETLDEHRPSRSRKFAERIISKLRPPEAKDWETVAELACTLEPDFRAGNDLWMRERREIDESRFRRSHYVVEHAETGRILGYGAIEQTAFRPQYRLFLVAAAGSLKNGAGDLLLDRLAADLREAEAILVRHRNYAHLSETLEFLTGRGFVESQRAWDLRLETENFDEKRFQSILDRVASLKVDITTLEAERRRSASSCERKLHEFLNEVKADDAAHQSVVPLPFQTLERYLRQPSVPAAACFIARRGEKYVGFTNLHLREILPGGMTCGFTGTHREFRRKGIATALKVHALEYARRNNYQNVRAFNRPENAEMLALNEKLGFRRAFSYVTLEYKIKQPVETGEDVPDAYTGHYQPDAETIRLGAFVNRTIIIKKVGSRLFSEAGDMLDELFPESETLFFTDHHYDKVEFIKNENGRVAHLIWHSDGRRLRADKITENFLTDN